MPVRPPTINLRETLGIGDSRLVPCRRRRAGSQDGGSVTVHGRARCQPRRHQPRCDPRRKP
jgi:hypothetical protein